MISQERSEQFLHKIEGGLASAAPSLFLAMPVMCQVGWWSYYEIPLALFGLNFYVAALWLCGVGLCLGIIGVFANAIIGWIQWGKKRGGWVRGLNGWLAMIALCYLIKSFFSIIISLHSPIISVFLYEYGLIGMVFMVFVSFLLEDELKEKKFCERLYIVFSLNFDNNSGGAASIKYSFYEWCGILFIIAAMSQALGYYTAAYYKVRLPEGGDGLAVGVFGENIIYRKSTVGGGYIFMVKAATSTELKTGAVKP